MEPDFEQIIRRGSEVKHGLAIPRLSQADCVMLFNAVCYLRCQIIVEIGAMLGTSSMVLGLAAKEAAGKVWSIEIRPRKEWRENIQYYALQDRVTLIQGNSRTINLKLPAQIDLLFIDGDHQTQSVLDDYYNWIDKVRDGGWIGFHDIYGPPSAKVKKAIEMILNKEPGCLNFVDKTPPARDCGTAIYKKIK